MSNQEHKDNLCDTVDELLKDIDSLAPHPRNKLLIYHRYLLAKISWDLTIADINMTWIKQTLDNQVSDYIRRNVNFGNTGCDFAVEAKMWAWFRKCLQLICPMPKHNTILSKKFTEQ